MNPSRSVLLVISNLGLGGAERQAFYLAVGLRKRGWDVTIASMIPWLAPSFATELDAVGVRFEVLQTEVAARPRPLLRAVRALARLMSAKRPDVIIGFMSHGALIARIMGWLWRVPKIVSSLRNERSTHRWHDWLLVLTRRLDHASVTNSSAAAESQVRAGVTTAAKSAVILNGFDLTRVGDAHSSPRANGIFTWLHIGVLRHEKDQRTLLAAAKELSRTHEFRLLIAGEGQLAESLEQHAAELGLDGRVEFLGKRSEIAELIAGADAFVMSSIWEGLPNVLIEAHAGGLPVVATSVGGCSEVVADGTSGFLVPPSDPARLADAMRRMMDMEPSARARMGAAGRSHVLSTFSMEKMVDSWASLISR